MTDDLESVAQHYARTFHGSTGIELDDLLQEARMAAWTATSNDRYDARRASLRTYASNVVYRRMCTLTGQHGRRQPPTEELDEGFASATPSPEDEVGFRELLRELPEDARIVVSMILSDAGAVANLAPGCAKRVIADALGWPKGRLQSAFSRIEMMLMKYGRPDFGFVRRI